MISSHGYSLLHLLHQPCVPIKKKRKYLTLSRPCFIISVTIFLWIFFPPVGFMLQNLVRHNNQISCLKIFECRSGNMLLWSCQSSLASSYLATSILFLSIAIYFTEAKLLHYSFVNFYRPGNFRFSLSEKSQDQISFTFS